jgi:hypothetical protein
VRGSLQSDSLVVLVDSPISRGFVGPALQVLYDVDKLTLLPLGSIPEELIDSPDIFRYLNRCSLFVFGRNRLYDFSKEFNALVDISFHHASTADPRAKEQYLASYLAKARQLNMTIKVLQ